ncbi:unnamed protein product [Cuscuta campestris]|uniref:Uncharacterized protein n=1 Tax=Cuscuta campestris TaxID=132261 RepID=A0A484NBP9_9ASTE|nr:unnamed protein product [Cuscuta campestris]
MLEFQTSCFESGDDILVGMLVGFCKEVSPFKTVKIVLEKAALRDSAHLLDVVYHIITPKMERIDEVAGDEMTKTNNQPATTTTSKKLVQDAQRIIQKINDSELLKRIVRSMPWKVLSNVPGLKVALQPIEYMCFPLEKEQSHVKRENGGTSNPPLAEEIKIPSVTELYQAGVNFFPINEGIENICFDDTKVLLRNMVAYEAGNTSIESVVFTRYTELMNGIVDTKDDARILREKGIISNRLKSDEEVAELWNGMSRSIRLTKVPFLDKMPIRIDVSGLSGLVCLGWTRVGLIKAVPTIPNRMTRLPTELTSDETRPWPPSAMVMVIIPLVTRRTAAPTSVRTPASRTTPTARTIIRWQSTEYAKDDVLVRDMLMSQSKGGNNIQDIVNIGLHGITPFLKTMETFFQLKNMGAR